MSEKPRIYTVVTATFGDVAGVLYDHDGEALWSHISSGEGWLQRDLTDGFKDRREALEVKYPSGYIVEHIGARAPESAMQELHALWDKNHPGWRDKEATDD